MIIAEELVCVCGLSSKLGEIRKEGFSGTEGFSVMNFCPAFEHKLKTSKFFFKYLPIVLLKSNRRGR